VIHRSRGSHVPGAVAVVDTFAVIAAVLVLGLNAVVVGVRSGWRAEGSREAS
jgi:hypothetical protein